ncbi:MAG: recombinase family protein [Deltaproteobacteria bacterium]|nr:recombinase family protein [Deltaproteobacteria bacterium]
MAAIHAVETEPKRCAIYTRKSTTHGLDQEFSSLDAQREACEAYIKSQAAQGWKLLETAYDDGGFSGANIKRPAFQRLLEDIEAGKVDVLVVNRLDRLSRSLADFVKIMERFSELDVDFVSVTQNFSTANAIGRLTLNMLMSFAEFEREMISERTREKVAAARRRGQWTGGKAPLGYRIEEKKLVIDSFEAVVTEEMYTLYLEHRSALTVSRMLNERGRVTKTSRPWTKNAVLHILKNPLYAGIITYGGEHYEGEHEAIIPRNTWQSVQDILKSQRQKRKIHYHNNDYFLRGLLQCDICGGTFIPASTHKNGKVYRYYRCMTRDKRGLEGCTAKQLPAESIESFVVERIKDATADSALVNELESRTREHIEDQKKKLRKERAGLPGEIAKVSSKIDRFIASLEQAKDEAEPFINVKISELGRRQRHLQERMETVVQELGALERMELETEWLAKTLGNFSIIWEAMTPENRHRLMGAIIDEVVVNEADGKIEVYMLNLRDTNLATEGDSESEPASELPSAPQLQLAKESEMRQ